jgi:hypothetical protein
VKTLGQKFEVRLQTLTLLAGVVELVRWAGYGSGRDPSTALRMTSVLNQMFGEGKKSHTLRMTSVLNEKVEKVEASYSLSGCLRTYLGRNGENESGPGQEEEGYAGR